jgi:hypothetical protein
MVITRKNGAQYRFRSEPPEPALTVAEDGTEIPESPTPRERFESLGPEDREKFLTARRRILKGALAGLDWTAPVIGHGGSLGSGLKSLFWKTAVDPGSPKPKARERGQAAIQSMLEAVDEVLWRDADLIVRQNEYGVTFILAGDGGIKFLHKGYYRGYGVGISVSYVPDHEAVRAEMFVTRDRMPYAVPFLIQPVAVGGRVFPFVAYSDGNERPSQRALDMTFLPGPIAAAREPGVRLEVGLSVAQGLVPMINQASTYIMTSKRTTLANGEMRIPDWAKRWFARKPRPRTMALP